VGQDREQAALAGDRDGAVSVVEAFADDAEAGGGRRSPDERQRIVRRSADAIASVQSSVARPKSSASSAAIEAMTVAMKRSAAVIGRTSAARAQSTATSSYSPAKAAKSQASRSIISVSDGSSLAEIPRRSVPTASRSRPVLPSITPPR